VHRIGPTGCGTDQGRDTTLINMSVDSDVLLNLKHWPMKENEQVPHFLASLESDHKQYLKVGDKIGCSYSSSFGHIITKWPELEAVNYKTNVDIGWKDYLARGIMDE